ncbi:MAG: glycosyltransferase family 2 protein [Candidatus Omnitrophica bacterium]|nr:glycosyltransferase family 2 protein [Candidatus Omnitrophota bacterium]
MAASSLSVIIPSYNSAATVAYTLDALLRQSGGTLREIIVADSSDDGKTVRLLEKYADRIRLIRLSPGTMPALARNAGAAEASSETLAFIDADAFPQADWLEKISAALAGGSRVGGGAILLPGRKRAKKFVPSCNLFCEKSIFDAVGEFPAIRASEDVLFGLAAGAVSKVVFHPEIRVRHIFREKLGAYLKNQKLIGRYILIYRRARGGIFYRTRLTALFLPAFVLVKFSRVASRVFRGSRENILPFFSALPLFMLGLFSWSAGFLGACLQKDIDGATLKT